jgi:outer membrane protein TolC
MNLIILFLMLISNNRDTLNLSQCYQKAYDSYPNAYAKDYYQSSANLKLKNLDVNFLPQVSFKGQATYQSDVTAININIPQFKAPELNKDHYQIFLDLKQLIYDGGSTSYLKDIEEKQLSTDNQKLEVELYALKQRVNDLFFSVLLIQEKKNITLILNDNIKARITEMESRIENGTISKNNLYILQAQLLQTSQDLENIEADRIATLNMLGQLIGSDLSGDTYLVMPNPSVNNLDISAGNRPEYKLFEVQKNQLEAYKNTVSVQSIPKVNLFGQAGYGRPGLNMLDNTFQPYYTVGINFQWNPINWNSNNNQIQIYEINKKIIDKQKETFDKNLFVTLERYKADILKNEKLLKQDEEIISLREKIVNSSQSQLQNGTITATDYLTELNNKNQAMLLYKTHQIQLSQAKINFLTTKGN